MTSYLNESVKPSTYSEFFLQVVVIGLGNGMTHPRPTHRMFFHDPIVQGCRNRGPGGKRQSPPFPNDRYRRKKLSFKVPYIAILFPPPSLCVELYFMRTFPGNEDAAVK